MILHDKKLGEELRAAFDSAKKRVWIAVPFIGVWDLVERITGTNWMNQTGIDIKIVTDINNEFFISPDTFEIFRQCAQLKTLSGLHAKLYIIDDFTLLTSANLSGAAFSKRYEIGIKLKTSPDLIEIFNYWWENAKSIDPDWTPTKKPFEALTEPEDSNISGLKKLWDLPKPQNKSFSEYSRVVNSYKNFLKLYEANAKRVLPELPEFQEIDAFFNYLFHEHPDRPSNEYINKKFRPLSENDRIKELKKYHKQYIDWIEENPTHEAYRINRMQIIKKILSPNNILRITMQDAREVTNQLHCMNSFPLNKSIFLNPNNNELDSIKNEWNNLLHKNSMDLEGRIRSCNETLFGFGKSAIQELLAWYYPNQFPVINRNSNSGMRFFGYDIKIY